MEQPNGVIMNSWRSYAENHITHCAGDVQIAEMRRAFFAGAAAVTALVAAVGDQWIDEGMAMEILSDISIEVNEFKQLG